MVGAGKTLRNFDAERTSPETVLASDRLSREQKVDLLLHREYDAAEEEVAEEDGMPGARDHLLGRILAALHSLVGDLDVEHVAPIKQHGLPSI